MENEKKKCHCKLLRWLIPVIAVVVALAVGLVVFLLRGKQEQRPLYWNIDRLFYSNESRKPDADGVYRVRMACNGEVTEILVKDRKLVEAMDSRNAMYLERDDEGVVTAVYDPDDLQSVSRKLYIKRVEGNTIYANGSMALNGKDYTFVLSDQIPIYDVMPGSYELGRKLSAGDLTMADAVVVYADAQGQARQIFVTARSGSANVYWRLTRLWNNSAKKTIRVPDAQGVYTVEFTCNGAPVTLKCKDADIVSAIDKVAESEAAFCFLFDKEGYISEIRDIRVGAHGIQFCPGYVVRSAEGRTFTAANTESVMVTFSAALPEECGIYDVSSAAFRDNRAGQAVEQLQVGDRIYVWTDADGTPLTVYIQHRNVDVPVYRVYPMCFYDSEMKQTQRKPDAQGWYNIEVIQAGEEGVKTYRTQDRDLVNFLDSQTATNLVGLRLDGDVITQVYASKSIYGGSVVNKGRYVAQVVGCTMNVQRVGKKGPTVTMVMTDTCKVYDISGTGPLGAETLLQPGDVVEAQSDLFGQIEAVFVTRR